MMLPTILLLAIHIQPETNALPNRQPQLAAGHGQVALAYGTQHAIYFASSPDNGRTFSPPVKVAEVEALALGRHRGPRVTILKDAILVSAIVGEKVSTVPHAHGLPADGNITIWRSVDHGKTWSRSGVVNDVPGAAREGFHAIAEDAKGNLTVVWLDLRVKGTSLYSSRSSDGGRTWSKKVLVYASPSGTICECCAPSLAIDDRGQTTVMWRNVLDGSRDLYMTTSPDGVTYGPVRKMGTGTWKLNACPMDGGGLVIQAGQPVSAWRRDGDIFLAQPGKQEQRIASGKDVSITNTKKGLYVAWSNGSRLEVLSPGATKPALLTAEGAFVNLVALPDGSVLAAWEADGSIHVERVPR
jgi:hypothetical protein